MLYSIGALTLDTRPFSVDEMQRSTSADFADKPVMGGMIAREFMGEGEEKITLSGQLLPFKTGGLTELEMAHGFRRSGQKLPVLRGDGARLGWYVIDTITENHTDLMRDGVGFFVKHSISLTKVSPDGASPGIIVTILSLFGMLE
ncbi:MULTISPECIES: phage tail protein [unclassified Rhizobium]|uniref:phage tail protein n=1 Tax=unclassified Rhizobium TaxID=2613769 RepID=UPI001ADA8424|nr:MULTISPECIES: phage tail protein [unclassified Rhizobium]MBO9125446.1 phage tail protein [Rhizobium sp. 16-488-2b]MBO9176031.1 phage tail protein [Rhizobium sp. 16-488-2a]